MTQDTSTPLFDKHVRQYIYEHFVRTGQVTTRLQCTQALACLLADVQAAYQRLADGRALVLQSNGACIK